MKRAALLMSLWVVAAVVLHGIFGACMPEQQPIASATTTVVLTEDNPWADVGKNVTCRWAPTAPNDAINCMVCLRPGGDAVGLSVSCVVLPGARLTVTGGSAP